jgi:hypothetical protein
MRVLVCGSRDWTHAAAVYYELNKLHRELGFDVVIEGDARGIDRIAGYWARRKRLDNLKFPADWERDGRGAGPIRNAKMLAEGKPDLVIAFPGGRGTANMLSQAEKAGVPVRQVNL